MGLILAGSKSTTASPVHERLRMNSWRGAVRRFIDPSPDRERRSSEEDYELLADHTNTHRRRSSSNAYIPRRRTRSILALCWPLSLRQCTLRRGILFLCSIPLLLAVGVLYSGIPPNFNDIREFERRLPQHDILLNATTAGNRYLQFPDHLWGHGLNNILQETLLFSYLAYMSNRSFVFEDYTWSHTLFPWTLYDFALRPKQVPLNAFISGPTAGGPMPLVYPPSSSTKGTPYHPPKAISAAYFDTVCPIAQRTIISTKEAPEGDIEGNVLIDWWVHKLSEVTESCVQIKNEGRPTFDRFLFGSPRILSMWPTLSLSPILQWFTWSPLVQSAVARNFAILQPTHPSALFDLTLPSSSSSSLLPASLPSHPTSVLSGLVAIHLRRGDYKRHCPRLAAWSSNYMGLNQFPSLPDTFSPNGYTKSGSQSPYGYNEDDATRDKEAHYLEHCLPSVEQIVGRLNRVRSEHALASSSSHVGAGLGLKRVYVLSNGWGWWLAKLQRALLADGWDQVIGSGDIVLDREQSYVGMAVDMAIAEKAELFVGNGFSSLSSNVVMLRMAKGFSPASNRFL